MIDCRQQKMLSTQDAEQPGIAMPRIERTNGGYLIGAIATYPTTSRRAVLLYINLDFHPEDALPDLGLNSFTKKYIKKHPRPCDQLY